MTPLEAEREVRLADVLEEAQTQLRVRQPLDVSAFEARYPDLADGLPALLETMRDLDNAAEHWKAGTTLDEAAAATDGSSPEQVTTITWARPAEMVGRYRILAKLGAGGMGTVYKAEDPQLHRVVAVKVPHFDGSRPDRAKAVQRFLREARAAAQVRHPHICAIHDVGEHQGTPYAVMDYIEGTSLAELLKKTDLGPARAVDLVRKVALGLEAVHAQGIIHRDLKPANILLDPSGEPLLTDFGLARPDNDAEHLTLEGTVVGTPAYMAPEQARGETERLGPWTDIYSLGLVLYRLLTGQLPFKGSPQTILYKIIHEPLPPPSSLRPDLSPTLEAIVLKALARQPEDRYQTAREFADALKAWTARAGSNTSETIAVDRSSPKTASHRRRWTLAAAAAVVLLLAGGIVWRLNWRDETTTPLRADLEMYVWKKAEPSLKRSLTDPSVLPLQAGDFVQLIAKANRPAYFYLVQVESTGGIAPMHPWINYDWNQRGPETARDGLRIPDDLVKNAAPLTDSPSGLEAIFLFVRATPLAAEEQARLQSGFADFTAAGKTGLLRGAIWLSDREPPKVTMEEDRGRLDLKQGAVKNDPLNRVRALLQGDLPKLFAESRAVCYAFKTAP